VSGYHPLVVGPRAAERLSVGEDGDAVVQQAVNEADSGGVLRKEPAPLVEGPMAADPERDPLVGGDDDGTAAGGPVSSSGAKPSSSQLRVLPSTITS